jgi:hypothetical protein
MKITEEELINGPEQTGKRMRQLVEKYYLDMAPWASLSLMSIFEIIKNIPFTSDPAGHEFIKRPLYTMRQWGPGGDCDDKMIALASWARLNKLIYNFIAVGVKKAGLNIIPLTHVLLEIKIDGNWVHCDPTYAFNVCGQPFKTYDARKVI